MTFEEQLRDLVDTLADRVRHEAAGHFQSGMVDLHNAVKTERNAAVTEAVREAREAADREAEERLKAAVADATRDADDRLKAAVEEARHAADRELESRLQAAVAEARREADDRLTMAVVDAAREAREAAEREAAERLDAAVAEAIQKEEGRRQKEEEGGSQKEEGDTDTGPVERLAASMRFIDEGRSLSEILDTLVGAARREAGSAALFLVRGDQLSSWRLSGLGSLDQAPRFEVPLSDAGLVGEAIRRRELVSADSAHEVSVPGFVSLPGGRTMVAVPLHVGGDVVAVLYGDQGENTELSAAWPTALEILVRHAGRALESMTAFRTASVFTGPPIVRGGGAMTSDADESEDTEAARRYARLLISDIKLSHESAVLAGRRERDLAARLGGEFARARVLYEQRVGSRAARTDHFHTELVRTLANGDASLLGN